MIHLGLVGRPLILAWGSSCVKEMFSRQASLLLRGLTVFYERGRSLRISTHFTGKPLSRMVQTVILSRPAL